MNVTESGEYKNLSASGLVKAGPGRVLGILVASSSSGTVKVWDNDEGSGAVIVNTMSVNAGTFYPIIARFTSGCYVTIGGTADLTVIYV